MLVGRQPLLDVGGLRRVVAVLGVGTHDGLKLLARVTDEYVICWVSDRISLEGMDPSKPHTETVVRPRASRAVVAVVCHCHCAIAIYFEENY